MTDRPPALPSLTIGDAVLTDPVTGRRYHGVCHEVLLPATGEVEMVIDSDGNPTFHQAAELAESAPPTSEAGLAEHEALCRELGL